jgi:hypothetical protein
MSQHYQEMPVTITGGILRTADCADVIAMARERKAKQILVILEDPSDIESYTLLVNAGLPVKAVAVTPEVCATLENQGIDFLPMSDAIDPGALFTASLSLYHSVEAFCDAVDIHLAGKYPALASFDSHPARDNFFSLYLLFDILLVRSTILRVLLEQTSPDMIVAFPGEGTPPAQWRGGMPFGKDEHIFPLLIGLCCSSQAILCTGPPFSATSSHPPVRAALSGRMNRWIRCHPLLRGIATAFLAERGFARAGLCMAFLRNLIAGNPSVAIIGFAYNWDYIFPDLVRHGFVPLHLPDYPGSAAPGTPHPNLIPDALLAKYGSFGGLDVSRIIADRTTPLLRDAIKDTVQYGSGIRAMIRRWQPCAFLCSTKTSFREHFAARIAQNNEIPVISWQHGAAGFFRYPLLAHTECTNTDLHLVWGEGVREEMTSEGYGDTVCRHEAVGSYDLQSLPDFPPAKTLFPVLYVTTSYFLSHYYYGYEHRFDDIRFWHTQKTILSAIGASGVAAILKLHPGEAHDRHISRYIVDHQLTSVSVVRGECSLQECLRQAGTVIIDFPSTTLLEALASGRVVFVLLTHFVLSEHAKALLKKRAYCSDDPATFARLIERYCNGEPLAQSPDVTNDEFLEHYGLYRHDRKVAERALAWLEAACKNDSTAGGDTIRQ